MNTPTRIIVAFAVGATAGAVLGILLKSPEVTQSKEISKSNGQHSSFLNRFFRAKKHSGSAQNAEAYEEA